MKKSLSFPDIKSYQNVFLYLQEYYSLRKREEPEFSYDLWAKELGFKNRSYLRFVVLGQRPINRVLQDAFRRQFGFRDEDADYFCALVHYSQSKTATQRHLWGRRLIALTPLPADTIAAAEHFDFLSDHLLPCLQTVQGFADAPSTPNDLAALFKTSEKTILEKMRFLRNFELNKISRSENPSWKIPDQFQSMGHKEFYRQTLQKAETAMELPFDMRRFRSLFIAMNPDEFTDFLKDFELFVREQLKKRDTSTLKGRRLYQLNFNLFPTTELFRVDETS